MVLPLDAIILLTGILVVVFLTLLYHARALSGAQPLSRRPIVALELMRRALAYGAETGRAIHLSPGAGAVGARATAAETVAGLLAAERVAAEAALNGAPILASSGDAVAHLALRGTLRQAYQRAGLGQDYDPANVQLLAHQDPMAYASGVTTLYGRQRLEASQLIGSFGKEFLLVGEVGAQREVPQLAGATTTTALPLVYLAADGALIGEEIYAAEAYLARSPAPQARLLTQDALRTAVIVAIVILVGLSVAGIRFAL
ncbi:MAG TPA: DUF6754 domain-containing protein [Roseiflexaceae bacterium]|nr:DUF6754 domain-containing protein [Roseiflexaceae bacterium]